jgi:hypothetical protein
VLFDYLFIRYNGYFFRLLIEKKTDLRIFIFKEELKRIQITATVATSLFGITATSLLLDKATSLAGIVAISFDGFVTTSCTPFLDTFIPPIDSL